MPAPASEAKKNMLHFKRRHAKHVQRPSDVNEVVAAHWNVYRVAMFSEHLIHLISSIITHHTVLTFYYYPYYRPHSCHFPITFTHTIRPFLHFIAVTLRQIEVLSLIGHARFELLVFSRLCFNSDVRQGLATKFRNARIFFSFALLQRYF